jgi:hypothetical protein
MQGRTHFKDHIQIHWAVAQWIRSNTVGDKAPV